MSSIFKELGLSESFLKALEIEKISSPTAIQTKMIPIVRDGGDVIGRSDTGTGKTLAYLLPILEKIKEENNLQAVIIAPTYELIIQIQRQIESIITNTNLKINSQPILGSVGLQRQIENLKKYPQIIVASSGRLLELISRKKIKMHNVKTLVLDEADTLVDENNITQTLAIVKTTLKDRQIIAVSATVSEASKLKLNQFMNNPQIIDITDSYVSTNDISHEYFVCDKRDKIEVLRRIAKTPNFKAIVFLNKGDEIEVFTEKLKYHNLKVECLHGSWSKIEREKAIREFRSGKINILVASDVAARGLDFKDVSHIISVDIPEEPKIYLHRSGRTGRAGKKGVSIAIVTDTEVKYIKKYEKKLGISFKKIFNE